MPDTRSGKSKVDQGEQNSELIEIITSVTEIKILIQLEEEKVVKKQKEGFDVTVWKLQERITTLEYKNDDLEQYGRRVCVRIEKVGEFFRETFPDIPVSCINQPNALGLNTIHTEIKRNIAAS